MNEFNWVELIGYVASALIAISVTMNSIVKLRIINMIGAFMFGTYGLLIGSIPVVLMNYFIGVTNIFYLWKLWKLRVIREES